MPVATNDDIWQVVIGQLRDPGTESVVIPKDNFDDDAAAQAIVQLATPDLQVTESGNEFLIQVKGKIAPPAGRKHDDLQRPVSG